MDTTTSIKTSAWIMLFSRVLLFAGVQAAFAVFFALIGAAQPWEASADWWLLVVVITNLITVALLVHFFRAEGKRYRDIFHIQRQYIKGDLLFLLAITVINAPLTYFPNILLGGWLFGDPAVTLDLFVRPLPMWAVIFAIFAFRITQGLAEVPTYFGYVMPRFEAGGMRAWLAVTIPSLMLGLQHIAMPLLFDVRFIAWRGLMYIPFAFLTGIVLHWRPRMLPYFAIVHVLINMSFATMFLSVAY